MKKVLFFAAALAVVSLTSCGSDKKDAEAKDTVNTEVGGEPAAAAAAGAAAYVDTIVTAEGVVTGYVDANGDTTLVAEIAETTEVAK
ncbi:MAG: hypothetical protein ACI30N_08095 [Muribaculaceae bacterium]